MKGLYVASQMILRLPIQPKLMMTLALRNTKKWENYNYPP